MTMRERHLTARQVVGVMRQYLDECVEHRVVAKAALERTTDQEIREVIQGQLDMMAGGKLVLQILLRAVTGGDDRIAEVRADKSLPVVTVEDLLERLRVGHLEEEDLLFSIAYREEMQSVGFKNANAEECLAELAAYRKALQIWLGAQRLLSVEVKA
jgi:hypothetical protein